MKKNADVTKIFSAVAKGMAAEFDEVRESYSHAGVKGTANENIVRDFLAKYLAPMLGVCTGQMVDADGSRSRQTDVIVYDSANTPSLQQSGDVRLIPIECAYAVLEVKADLDGNGVAASFANMGSIRRLRPRAFKSRPTLHLIQLNMYGDSWSCWPVNYHIFAFESCSLSALQTAIEARNRDQPLNHRIDSVCVLNQGVLCNEDNGGRLLLLPGPDTHLVSVKTDKALLLFYRQLSSILNEAFMPVFDFQRYVDSVSWQKD